MKKQNPLAPHRWLGLGNGPEHARMGPATVMLDALGSPRNVNIGGLSIGHSPTNHTGLDFADLCPPSTPP